MFLHLNIQIPTNNTNHNISRIHFLIYMLIKW